MLTYMTRALAAVGIALFLVGAPRAIEDGSNSLVMTSLYTLPVGLGLTGLALLYGGRGRTRLAGIAFAAALAELPFQAVLPLPPLVAAFVGAAIGSIILATIRTLPGTTRLALVVGLGAAVTLAMVFGPLAQTIAPPTGLVLALLGLFVAAGPLLFALDASIRPDGNRTSAYEAFGIANPVMHR